MIYGYIFYLLQILIPVPSNKERLEILNVHISKLPVHNLDIQLLADITNSFVGADLVSLCQEAAYIAMADHNQKEQVKSYILYLKQSQ